MKWDIDKALASYAAPGALVEHSIARILLAKYLWKQNKIKPKLDDESKADATLCWSLGIGRWGQPKLFVVALTLRECHSRMRKVLLGLDDADRRRYGVQARPARSKTSRRDTKRNLKKKTAKG
jgi:hypothetical protein